MKKIAALLSIVLMLVACDNGGMENENIAQPQEPDYYPYEVSNLQYTIEKGIDPQMPMVVIVVTWDVPTDPDFSHVKYGYGVPNTDPSKPKGENSTQIFCGEPVSPHTFFCISKDGKVSKGVRCDFGYTWE